MSIKNQLKDQSNQLLTITFHNKIENLNAHRVDITIDNKTKTILFDGGIQSFDVLQTTLQSLVDNTKFAQSISSNFTTAGKGLSDDEITLVDIFLFLKKPPGYVEIKISPSNPFDDVIKVIKDNPDTNFIVALDKDKINWSIQHQVV